MLIDAEFTIKIKMSDLYVKSDIIAPELRAKIIEEGEKRLRYYLSGYLLDPEGQIVKKDINFKIKQN